MIVFRLLFWSLRERWLGRAQRLHVTGLRLERPPNMYHRRIIHFWSRQVECTFTGDK